MKAITLLFGAIAVSALAQSTPQPATDATKAANAKLLTELPFQDKASFDQAHKGFVAPLPQAVIKSQAGNPIWNPKQYDFIKEGEPAPDSVNPGLWRQSQLINISGLFQVTDGVYQTRNQDLSNMTIVEGKEGITIFDPLVSTKTAKAVIYTHSHVDHYGGVRGVVSKDDVEAGKVKIYAPIGFLDAAVAENVMVGNAMSPRASYMYGNLLPADQTGHGGTRKVVDGMDVWTHGDPPRFENEQTN